ncbi:hypothetical protein [Phenylobacterium sp.]|uniref:hypothetical protein n=1 Tax=Phenylobacterium sp. TaxID=1871053 RepID=UPI0025D81BA7|nr:hypothetical protein [Phenylobacterium sp.]
MTLCAYELGVAASEIAKRVGDDLDRFLAASAEFRHCFFGVRMGIRLTQAARMSAGAAPVAAPAERPERERSDAADPPERGDAPERFEAERDREGDYEPVSLPQFLKTLGLAAVRAEQHRDELPAHIRDTTLPTLQALLRQARPPPEATRPSAGAAAAILARPPTVPAARSRLLTSTGAIGLPALRPIATRRRDSG